MGKRVIWGAESSGVIRKFVANCVEELREFLFFRGKKIKLKRPLPATTAPVHQPGWGDVTRITYFLSRPLPAGPGPGHLRPLAAHRLRLVGDINSLSFNYLGTPRS